MRILIASAITLSALLGSLMSILPANAQVRPASHGSFVATEVSTHVLCAGSFRFSAGQVVHLLGQGRTWTVVSVQPSGDTGSCALVGSALPASTLHQVVHGIV